MTFQRIGIVCMTAILLFLYSCKEQKPIQQKDKVTSTKVVPIPKSMQDLIAFANLSAEVDSDLDEIFIFKRINPDGTVSAMERTEATKLVKRAMSGKQSEPILVETVPAGKAILFVMGRGYGGSVWGKLLLNPADMTFEKVVFQHSAESEGYGAAMTLSSFENQFTKIDISSESFRFGLKQNNRELLAGSAVIDGISGATITSESVVEMMNSGLDQYSDYLKNLPNPKS